MELESRHGQMEAITEVNGLMTSLQVVGNTHGAMVEFTKVTGRS